MNQSSQFYQPANIDVIIPCYNAAATLDRAIDSVLHQDNLGRIWLIDDASTDETWQRICQWQSDYPALITAERFWQNKGVAHARNWGAMLSKAPYIAFLDADDAYQSQVLEACAMVFAHYQAGLIRLPMLPVGLADKYREAVGFGDAWRAFEMTAGSNMVFDRCYFLALGGFDDADVFRRFGGEDGALGLATLETSMVVTLFDNADFQIGVNYHCHDNMHVQHLLDAVLFGINTRQVTADDVALAQGSTDAKIVNIHQLKTLLAQKVGKLPVKLS